MIPQFPNFSEESLKVISVCPVCNTKYNPIKAQVLEEQDGAHLVYIKCNKCHSSIIVLVMTNSLGVSSVGLVTDLNGEDVLKFKSSDSVSVDDVIEMHDAVAANQLELDKL
ncbi:MAG: hypothetical protein COT81_00250 [Candidatus Buchananbacteria bacterium CG10_big_fil_rev_8_21_14_0_10_42_9]|uniref:Uncharacterized protein n=1 Tax=Candidatus Buchananbacteria bacterium CG10_big_fil_rev_8_21_14_0_10_42_9 TaxID=1974526 RepID=A0A2H0W2I8_9BACT|nr:MAG: hypothetical protein COT81_00250 [Candidatus Buchananbacteria bacterium CG10_big_fil_rev_8_21_14_0_10_42_9]